MAKGAGVRAQIGGWASMMLLLALAPLPAMAAKKMSVEQLQQFIAAAQTQHRSDADVTRVLANVKLTERLSTPVLDKLIAASPGEKTTQSLHILADAAVFLDPPPNEVPAQPAPNIEAQKAMIVQTAHYVARTLPTLPNFVATRVVNQLVDAQQLVETEHPEALGGMFRVNTYRTPIAVRDGQETDDPAVLAQAPVMKQAGFGSKPNGMTSQGEFGPILLIVLMDAAKGKMSWARWENVGGAQLAVYRFSVDKPVSHFQLNYRPRPPQGVNGYAAGTRFNSNHIRSPRSAETIDIGADAKVHFVGYHGLLAVDPATGAIMRIVIEAEFKPGDEMQRPSMMVEYGPVKIGDSTYICPKHSVAISVFEGSYQLTPTNPEQTVNAMHLNDVEFTGYRRFGSEVKLVATDSAETADTVNTAAAAGAANGSSSGGNGATTEASTEIASVGSNVVAAAPSPSPVAPAPSPSDAAANASAPANVDSSAPPSVASAASSTPAVAASSVPEAKPATAATEQEFSLHAVDAGPGMGDVTVDGPDPASGASGNGMNFNLKVATRLVDIGLVVTDKHGKPITDLKQDEIEVEDNGHKVQLTVFHPAETGTNPATPAQESSDTFTNTPQTADSTVAGAADQSPELLILLLDESHLAFADLNRARQEVLRFLKASRPNARIALYALNEQGFRILQDVTQDHALVMAQLTAWTPSARAAAQGQALDRRNRQQIDTVHNPEDLNHVNGNNIQTPDGVTTSDPELRQMGASPLRSALQSMTALARHFATVPGHKSLAWISGDSALADFQDQAVGIDKASPVMHGALQHTREALNEAHIALYAVDASNVEGGGVDPSLANSSVQLDQTSAALSDPNRVATGHISGARSSAQMQQDTHGIQTPVRQLAEATGGRAISKGSDLKAALDGIEQEAGAFYEIGFDPDGAADGKYHNLQVKVAGRKDVKLRYRSGYLYNEVSTDTMQRMQQMIWNPQDATGVAFTVQAFPADAAGAGNVKLRISFPGIALEKHDDRWTDQLYIFVAQRDEATQQADVSGETLGLSLKQATYDSGLPAGIPYRHAVAPKSKFGSVRVIVVDSNSGKMGTVTVPYSALRAQ
jgi:VWFA-related protein